MQFLMILTAVGLLAVGLSVGRAALRGEFGRIPFVPLLLAVCGLGSGAAIFLAFGGV